MASGKIGTAYVQVRPSMDGVASSVKNYFNGSGKESGASFGSNLVSTVKKILVAAGIGESIKKSITEGAALQQSLGGIDTLFKENADRVIANADQVYRTCGLSANRYMEQVTSFSASLLQSLGGDTSKAANVADMALTDMSDNANKFGTDMERITDAYQGFAKQNYTMLDNLKLGYGGTKSEMQRLLSDAQKLTGVKYDINNLSDVYNAIHAIQENLGVTGTTAEEAASTISGSAASMKAAFSNVLGNLSLGRDIGPSLEALAETTVNFLSGNLAPAIINIFSSLPNAIKTFVSALNLPSISDLTGIATNMMDSLSNGLLSSIPSVVSNALPMLLQFSENLRSNAGRLVDSGINLIMQVGNGLIASIPSLISTVPQIVTNICGIINDNAPKLMVAGIQLLINLGKGIVSAIPSIISNFPAIVESIFAVFQAANWLKIGGNIVKGISNGAKSVSNVDIGGMVSDLFKNIGDSIQSGLPKLLIKGGSMVENLVQGFIKAVPSFLNSAKSVISGFGNIISGALPSVMSHGTQIVQNLISGIGSVIPNLISTVSSMITSMYSSFIASFPSMLSAGAQLIGNVLGGMRTIIPNLISTVGSVISSLFSSFVAALPSMLSAGAQLLGNVVGGIVSNIPAIVGAASTVVASMLTQFASYLPDLLAQGISLIANLIAGLISMIPDIISAAGDIIKNIKEQFSNIDWAEIGKNIIQGIANGIKNCVSTIIEAAKEAAQKAFEAAKKKLDINSPSKLFRKEIGYNISAGMALGISDGIPLVEYAANSLSRASTSAFSGKLAASSGKVSSAAGQSNGKAFGKLEINQYINSKAQTAADLMIECRYNAELAVMLGV